MTTTYKPQGYNRSLKAGARSLCERQNHDYGERLGGVEDPFGSQWYIATNISLC